MKICNAMFALLVALQLNLYPETEVEPVDLTIQGKTYQSAKLTRVTENSAVIMHSSGSKSFELEKLTAQEIEKLNSSSETVSVPSNWRELLAAWKVQQQKDREAMRAAYLEAQRIKAEAEKNNPSPEMTEPVPAEPKVTEPVAEEEAPPEKASYEGLRLSAEWNKGWGGKSQTQDDLKRLFGGVVTGKMDSKPHPDLELVPGIHYLMPVKDALKAIGAVVETSNACLTPGFPHHSFHYVGFSGNFGMGFNRMFLLLDKGNKVVSVQFVNQSPRGPNRGEGNGLARSQVKVPLTGGWKTFNFVQLNRKGSSSTSVRMGILAVPGKSPALYQIDSGFYSGGGLQEIVRWYVPQPIADLIHFTAGIKGKGITGASGLGGGGL